MNPAYTIKYLVRSVYYQYSHMRHRDHFREYRESEGEYSLRGFDKHRCIFIHIPKTAGISVNKALFGDYGGGHKDVTFYKRAFGPLTYRTYFTFTFVRNPYSRVLSAYLFLKKGGFYEKDKKWAEKHLSQYSSFGQFVEEWLNEETIHTYNHFVPQHSFVCDIDLVPDVDFIGRFEKLEEDFQYIAGRLRLDVKLPVLNKTGSRRWEDYYTPELAEKVREVYREDFEVFGYDTEVNF
ncbi:sulfotransferase family 2 domain-containing protein [Rhodohalobacter sp. 8-1]|uniref:sulfotransferase family 2 domain-containing protein n=1 Tax=Rhodohalobacter sp. 8-1 TaxID=3131972 RepID=UPI0030EE7FEF